MHHGMHSDVIRVQTFPHAAPQRVTIHTQTKRFMPGSHCCCRPENSGDAGRRDGARSPPEACVRALGRRVAALAPSSSTSTEQPTNVPSLSIHSGNTVALAIPTAPRSRGGLDDDPLKRAVITECRSMMTP